jgi:hypothetical protein
MATVVGECRKDAILAEEALAQAEVGAQSGLEIAADVGEL